MTARPRLRFLGTVVESARQTTLRLCRQRLWWIVLGSIFALVAVGWLLGMRLGERTNGQSLFCILAWWLHGTVLVPWFALYVGVQAVHGSLEDRTALYLFLRPVGRVPLLLGNWLAVSILSASVAVLGTLALFVGLAANPEVWTDGVHGHVAWVFAGSLALGAVAYAAAAVFFSAAVRRPLVWAAFFVVGLQQLTANLPVSAGLRQFTITDPLRRLVLDGIEPDARLADLLWPAETFQPEKIGTPIVDLAWLVGVTLVLACWFYRRTEYDARPRD